MKMKRLKNLRLENGLTQQKLCEKLMKMSCCIDRTAYSKYENGIRKLPCDILIKLAELYGTSTDYILGLSDKK